MIGKIFTFKNVSKDIYIEVIRMQFDNCITGKVIKSDSPHYYIGYECIIYLPVLTEISKEQFDKIMVFE